MKTETRYCFGQVRALAANVEETRTIEFVISNATRDRHGTVLNPEGWHLDNFDMNGIAGYQHEVYGGDLCNPSNPDNVLGPAKAWREGNDLIGSIQFETKDINPLAEKIFRKILNGTLKAASVGFIEVGQGKYGVGEEARGGANETYYFTAQELLEFSVVNIPSNPAAVKRSLREQTYSAIMYIKRQLPGSYSFSDIESMKVGDVIRMLDGEEGTKEETTELEVNEEIETEQADSEREMTLKLLQSLG